MTNFEEITQSPKALADIIVKWQKNDPVTLWCNDLGCADLGDDFDCTDEMQAACIGRWLTQTKKG